MDELERAVQGVVGTCLGVGEGENVVVVVDRGGDTMVALRAD